MLLGAERRRGFTLIELMLSIAIMSILTTFSIFAIAPQQRLSEANESVDLVNVQQLEARIRDWQIGRQKPLPELRDTWKPLCRYKEACECGVHVDEIQDDGYVDVIPYDPSTLDGYTGLEIRNDDGFVKVRVADYGGFNPTCIDNLTLWLDAADEQSVFTDAGCTTAATIGQRVACWQDKSGLNNHATQAVDLNARPWFRADALEFNGDASANSNVGQYFNIPKVDGGSLFVVTENLGGISYCHDLLGKPRVGSTYRHLFVFGPTLPASNNMISFDGSDAFQGRYALNGTDFSGYAEDAAPGYYPAGLTMLHAEWQNLGQHTDDWEYIGRMDYANLNVCKPHMDIKEFILFNRLLTPQERVRIEQYLAEKWGISLSSDHGS